MTHIDLNNELPGIAGLLQYRPTTGRVLSELAEVLLRSENSLSRGERELIAMYVSKLNACHFCHTSHATFAALQLEGGWATVDAVIADPNTEEVSAKLRALLTIAALVATTGRDVTQAVISVAREAGASDIEIHDTVLIAAAFCMFNRYVDGLGTWAPPNRDDYANSGAMIVEHGYLAALAPRDH
jgi:uncharacterized peroxidase-related enzyme